MNCPNCKNNEVTNAYHDKCILDDKLRQLDIDCDLCGEVFTIYKDDSGKVVIKNRDDISY